MKKLPFIEIDQVDELAWPSQSEQTNLDSSALEIFTDFTEYTPLVIETSVPAIEALVLMQKTHVRLKLVVDKNEHFIGVVSLDDLNKQELLKKLSEGHSRDELCVGDFMRPRKELKAFDYDDLTRSSIRDVINTLQNSGHQHYLVIDKRHHKIRGIISSSDIARKMHLNVDIKNRSSFANVFQAIA